MNQVTSITKLRTIQNWIDIDVKYGRTFDLPKLRYAGGGGIPVFLWDNCQTLDVLDAALSFSNSTDSKSLTHPSAVTKNKYVPWYNMGESRDAFAAYCLEEYEDLDFLDIPEYTKDVPLQLEGKVYNLNLEAIVELDLYYENNETFNRVPIEVYPSKYYQQPKWVWAYLNTVDQLATFNTTTSEYMLDEDVDPTVFRKHPETYNKDVSFYSF